MWGHKQTLSGLTLMAMLTSVHLVACPEIEPASNEACLTESCIGSACDDKIKAGWCFIDNQCFQDGQTLPGTPCTWCEPAKSNTAGVGKCSASQTCTTDGLCLNDGDTGVDASDASNTSDSPETSDEVALGDEQSGVDATPEEISHEVGPEDIHQDGTSCAGNPPNCLNEGLCEGYNLTPLCANGLWICDYSVVVGFQAPEPWCDGIDSDCDGVVDNGFGVGSPCDGPDTDSCALGATLCDPNDVNGTICDELVDTGLHEVCDGEDNDCNGDIDDGLEPPESDLKAGACSGAVKTCQGSLAWTEPDYSLLPGFQPEETLCDSVDNDCDGEVDEQCPCFFMGLTQGVCADGTLVNNVCTQSSFVDVEGLDDCDGLDNDCDGIIDETCLCDFMGISDGVCATATISEADGTCLQPELYGTAADFGCDDGVDNNCNGLVDESNPLGCAPGPGCPRCQ